MADDLEFRPVPAGTGDAADLVAAMVAEMRDLYDGLDLEAPGMPKAGPAELGPPGGVYLVGYRDGVPVCRLDTGERQPHAQAFYEASGYRPTGNFNDNPAAAFHGEKRLD